MTTFEIQQRMSTDAAYREDIEYIHETVTGGSVFVGQMSLDNHTPDGWEMIFTVGMNMYGMPELVLTGVPLNVVEGIIEKLCVEATDFDKDFLAGKRSKVVEGFNVTALTIDRPETLQELQICRDYYALHLDSKLNVCQLVFANEGGIYPWNREYSEIDRLSQPLLAMPAALN